jgi:hypothetical protein
MSPVSNVGRTVTGAIDVVRRNRKSRFADFENLGPALRRQIQLQRARLDRRAMTSNETLTRKYRKSPVRAYNHHRDPKRDRGQT